MYIGKFVFLERLDEKGHPDYYSGEYLITQESDNVLYGIKPIVGYDSHSEKALPIVGSQAYQIINVAENWEAVKNLIENNHKFVATPIKERSWISSVYESSKYIVDKLQNIYDAHCKQNEESVYVPKDNTGYIWEVLISKPEISIDSAYNESEEFVVITQEFYIRLAIETAEILYYKRYGKEGRVIDVSFRGHGELRGRK